MDRKFNMEKNSKSNARDKMENKIQPLKEKKLKE